MYQWNFLTAGRDGWLRTFTLRPISELVQSHDDQTNIYDERPMLFMPTTKRWHGRSRKQFIGDTHSSFRLAMGAPNSNVHSPASCTILFHMSHKTAGSGNLNDACSQMGQGPLVTESKRWPVGNATTDSLCIVAGFKETGIRRHQHVFTPRASPSAMRGLASATLLAHRR